VRPGGFSPHSTDAQEQALALHPARVWRRDDRRGNRLVSGASADGEASGASWLLLSTGWDQNGANKENNVGAGRAGGRTRAGVATHGRASGSSLLETGSMEELKEG